MTKAKTKPCMCCQWYAGGIPCAKGHKPRMFVGKGLRRVCDDFQTAPPKPHPADRSVIKMWVDYWTNLFHGRSNG